MHSDGAADGRRRLQEAKDIPGDGFCTVANVMAMTMRVYLAGDSAMVILIPLKG